MIVAGLMLAVMITAGFIILFYKLPLGLRIWLADRYLLLDAFFAWATFASLGFSLIGLFAAAIISLFVSAYLEWYKRTGYKTDIAKRENLRQQLPKFSFYKCFIRGCAESVVLWRKLRA